MKKLWNLLKGKKTYFVAGATIVYAVVVVGWNGGDVYSAFELVLAALGASTLRHGLN